MESNSQNPIPPSTLDETTEYYEGFFSSKRTIFENAEKELRHEINKNTTFSEGTPRFLALSLTSIFRKISAQPDLFEKRCGLNIGYIGDQFTNEASYIANQDFSRLDAAFALAYRFLIEFQLMTPGELSDDLARVAHQVTDHEFSGNLALTIKYAEHQMVLQVLGKYIHHPGMIEIKELPKTISRLTKERETNEKELSEREQRANNLKRSLDTYKDAFNFVGLHEGFRKLRQQKTKEGRLRLSWLFLLGGAMTAPFTYKMYAFITNSTTDKTDTYLIATVVGFEILLGYFFRVALHGYRAIKAQLIQIDLRMALCQFIQEYAKYAKDIRKDSPELLDRFDQLIFSGIVNSEAAIPSTLDGLEHVANVLDKLKAKPN